MSDLTDFQRRVYEPETKALRDRLASARVAVAEARSEHYAVEVEPSDTICGGCSWRLPNGRFFGKVIEWPCPAVGALDRIGAALGVTP